MKKDAPKWALRLSVIFACLLTLSSPAQAQGTPGVSDKEILIGS